LLPNPALEAELATLPSLILDDLRVRWRRLFRSTAPEHLPKSLLLRIITYKLQANASGDLDRGTLRYLNEISRAWRKRTKAGVHPGKATPPVPAVPERRSLKPGTLLVREHEGVLHQVIVVEGGFAWGEQTYRSLSEVARAITGTNWNGPRFFGLRDTPKAPHPSSKTQEVRS
jgi:hypothetical protein